MPSAPELNKTVTVMPDGRIALPLIAPVMAADRTSEELKAAITQAYSAQLLRPDVTIAVKTTMPLRIFVGGEVGKPGIYDMPGDLDALQAVIQAGGFMNTAKRTQVVIIRRGANGRAMMRTVDLMNVFRNAGETDLVPLRRFDIVYVPRTRVAEAALFVQQYFRDLSPIQFGFSYALNGAKVKRRMPRLSIRRPLILKNRRWARGMEDPRTRPNSRSYPSVEATRTATTRGSGVTSRLAANYGQPSGLQRHRPDPSPARAPCDRPWPRSSRALRPD